MIKFAWVLAVAAVLGVASASTAAPVLVFQDSGNLGEFSFTNTGITGGTATIAVSAPSVLSTINTVNGAIVTPEPVHVTTPLTFTVTPIGGGDYTINLPAGVTKTVGAVVGQQAIMGFNLLIGNTPNNLPNFFNASGAITSLLANANPNYDFSNFGNASLNPRINFTFTATSFTGTTNFAGLFSTVGATAVGNGSFSQQAVPEPSSVALLGLGLAGVATTVKVRRRRAAKV